MNALQWLYMLNFALPCRRSVPASRAEPVITSGLYVYSAIPKGPNVLEYQESNKDTGGMDHIP